MSNQHLNPAKTIIDDEDLGFSSQFFIEVITDGFKRHRGKIYKIATILVILICSYILLVYKDSYVSEALVYIDRTESPAIVPEAYRAFFDYGDSKVNIYKSQLELLKSDMLVKRLYRRIRSENIELTKALGLFEPDKLYSYISSEYLKETDFIAVRAKAPNPLNAQALTQYYVDEYVKEANSIRVQPYERKRQIIQTKIEGIEQELENKTKQLQAFQETEGLIDVQLQGAESVTHMEELRNQIDTLEAEIAEKEAANAVLKTQLSVDLKTAIDSIAKGENSVYDNMREELAGLEKDYKANALTYTSNHPVMQELATKIKVLKQKLLDEERYATGHTNSKNTVIKDEVRKNIADRLANSDAELSAARKKHAVVVLQLSKLESRLGLLPTKQVKFRELDNEIKSLSDVAEHLRKSLSEILLQQSVEKVYLYSPATLPDGKSFPTQFQVFLFSLLFVPFLTYFCFVIYEYIRQSQLCRIDELEQKYGLSVLTVIPWIGAKKPLSLKLEILSNVYNTFALKLKNSEKETGRKTFFISSILPVRHRNFYALQSLATSLAKTNDKVLILDLNVSQSQLRYQLSQTIDLSNSKSYSELVEELKTAKTAPQKRKVLEQNIYVTETHPDLAFFDMYEVVEDNFEFFNSDDFKYFMDALKTLDFQWILADGPALTEVTEAFSLLKRLDGLILLVEKSCHRSEVYQLIHQVKVLDGHLAGIALRQTA